MQEFYEWITKIGSLNFEEKSVLIIGGGRIAQQHALACLRMNVKDITIISKTGDNVTKFCNKYKIKSLMGGFESNLNNLEEKDLTIIVTPISILLETAKSALNHGQKTILIEKPGSIYYKELLTLHEKIKSEKVRVGYNRLVYPSLHKLFQLVKNDGGISSCRFTFTEILDRIDFQKDIPEIYNRWGISNSLHVISMIRELIGSPKEIFAKRYGKLDWHKTGSIFVGNGISEKNIPFSYHADWEAGGRWGIEVSTKNGLYQLIPLEKLYFCTKNTFDWKEISIDCAFSDVKPGIAEEIAIMLSENEDKKIDLISLKEAAELNILAETIFGYD